MTNETALDDLAGWIGVYREGQAKKAAAEELMSTAREKIEQALGDNDTGTIHGIPVVRWTHVISNRLDTKLAKKFLTPEQLQAATVETETRRFTLVEGA